MVHPPRQIYASAADRRTGRRWTRRHRHTRLLPPVLLASVAGVALAASEMLRSIG